VYVWLGGSRRPRELRDELRGRHDLQRDAVRGDQLIGGLAREVGAGRAGSRRLLRWWREIVECGLDRLRRFDVGQHFACDERRERALEREQLFAEVEQARSGRRRPRVSATRRTAPRAR
jgi:hypothetical protein